MYPVRHHHDYWSQQAPQHGFHQPTRHQGFSRPNIVQQLLAKIKGPGGKAPLHTPHAPFQMTASKYHNFHDTLNHIQKGLGMVQQVLPLWKQYGPLIKNAPMFIDMVKLMMEEDEGKKQTVDDHKFDEEQIAKMLNEDDVAVQSKEEVKIPSKSKHQPKGLPQPKLYI
ncbi:VrrA/YqfQ family protein [Alkalibacillus haloalkaliphilus]|uniref:VrrA/YqfQ family protein n=1 Tax=Alkalibacillus haloalkaliphilus TaxID=94136 RepID=UPI000314EE2A|nr:VrrA/YqfQ family protein [Alkalibacillus haloalkaliphilus]